MARKTPDRTPITLLEEIFPQDTNPYGTAFGGKILAMMDRAAGLAASRYACLHFVTASLDAVAFVAPVRQGEVAQVSARVVYVSRRTCAVKAEVFAIDKTRWACRLCGQGILFMVAMGPEGRPLPVPGFIPRGQAARAEWREAAAIHRRLIGRKRRPAQRRSGRPRPRGAG